jgi:hypothetical protein
MCFILNHLKFYGNYTQAPKIIFEMKKKRNIDKNNKKKNKLSNLQNDFFSFFSLWTPPMFKPHNFISSPF